jgi:hypothetical protein
VTDLASRIADLQTEFQRLADRASGVGAFVMVRPGQILAFGFGRSGADGYAIYQGWSYDGSPPSAYALKVAGAVGWRFQNVVNHPVYRELLTLTERAGTLLQEAQEGGHWTFRPFPSNTPSYSLFHPTQHWLAFLLHGRRTSGCCLAQGEGGMMVSACGQIGEGETTLAWIDQYAEVCLAGLALLKAELKSSSLASTEGGTLNEREKTIKPCIVYCGGRQYSIGDYEPITLTETEDMVLKGFLGDPPKTPALRTMNKPTLCTRSGVEHAPRILKKLRSKYDARFESAISLPPDGKKASGGYSVHIRRGKGVRLPK